MSGSPAATSGVLAFPSYVLGRLHHKTRAVVEQELAGVGIGLREYFTLAHINELAAASQQQVADRAHMDRSDLVRLLDGLEARGLITRERDPDDRRRHVLALTAAGTRCLEQATTAAHSATTRAFAALTQDELCTLHHLALKALDEAQLLPGTGARVEPSLQTLVPLRAETP
jgi:DNA-binding MarR family transcriptional regulator